MLCDPTASEGTELNWTERTSSRAALLSHLYEVTGFSRMRSRLYREQRSCIKGMCAQLWRNQMQKNADYPN
jgi:hypothetical protein